MKTKTFFSFFLVIGLLIIAIVLIHSPETSEKDVQGYTFLASIMASSSSQKKRENKVSYSNEWMIARKEYADYGDTTCMLFERAPVFRMLFRKWIKMAERLSVPYTLISGSLLGAFRDGGMIPYTYDDIDVLIDIHDMEKLEKVSDVRNFSDADRNIHFVIQEDWRRVDDDRRRIACDGKQVDRLADACSFIGPVGRLIFADSNNFYVDLFAYAKNYDSIRLLLDEHVEISTQDYFPFKKCIYLGIQTWCPQNPELILNRFYGKDLRPHERCVNKKWVSKEEKDDMK